MIIPVRDWGQYRFSLDVIQVLITVVSDSSLASHACPYLYHFQLGFILPCRRQFFLKLGDEILHKDIAFCIRHVHKYLSTQPPNEGCLVYRACY